jgi:hypothetical protein
MNLVGKTYRDRRNRWKLTIIKQSDGEITFKYTLASVYLLDRIYSAYDYNFYYSISIGSLVEDIEEEII